MLIIVSGFAALGGHMQAEKLTNMFEGTTASTYAIATVLYNVLYGHIGYSNANYALSETKNPVRTLKIAAPVGLSVVFVFYMLTNIAYFAAVPKDEIMNSGRVLAASFFRNIFGPKAECALSVFIILSAFGNVLSVMFTQGRLVQEIGREGILPFSRLWASNKPCNAPFVGLLAHWVISVICILVPPPGDAYNFILNVICYPLAVINLLVAAGLVYLYIKPAPTPDGSRWTAPVRATAPIVVFFLFANIFMVVARFIPPTEGKNIYKDLPYYLHCVVGISILAAGVLYWVAWAKLCLR